MEVGIVFVCDIFPLSDVLQFKDDILGLKQFFSLEYSDHFLRLQIQVTEHSVKHLTVKC